MAKPKLIPDKALSSTSVSPVENRAISGALDDVSDTIVSPTQPASQATGGFWYDTSNSAGT